MNAPAQELINYLEYLTDQEQPTHPCPICGVDYAVGEYRHENNIPCDDCEKELEYGYQSSEQ